MMELSRDRGGERFAAAGNTRSILRCTRLRYSLPQ
jgi:hypothetical protein